MESNFRPTQSRSTQNDTTPFFFFTLYRSHTTWVWLVTSAGPKQSRPSISLIIQTPPNQTNGPDQILILFLPSATNTHKQNTQTANSIPFQNLPLPKHREREREKWRTLKKQSWATSRRTRLPNGSFSTLLLVKSNTLPKVFFHSLCEFFDFWLLIFGIWIRIGFFLLRFFRFAFCSLCVVLINWVFVHFEIFFLCFVWFFGRCESDTKRRRIVQRGSFGGVSVVQQITHDLPWNAWPSRRCESLNFNELLKNLVYFVCVCCLILILGFHCGHLHW